ncbi:MoaD/ThiS family protein [Acinetobacter haemolyticus]|nr:MoaD/ThiS family protein [Acinetobacter haemolyticus]
MVAQYPQVVQALEKCACAIGEDIVPRQSILKEDTQLVLLSPVAGG